MSRSGELVVGWTDVHAGWDAVFEYDGETYAEMDKGKKVRQAITRATGLAVVSVEQAPSLVMRRFLQWTMWTLLTLG